TVVVRNTATNQEFTTQTNEEGTFSVPTLISGTYTATVTAKGFKQAMVTEIKIDVGKPSSVNVALEVGSANETVTIVGGGELLQTQTATVGTTLTGRQITDLPTASRDALDLVLALPGTSTVGRPRQSSVNGLPKGALNITLDGINVQDNLLKSNDGFFTYIRPRTDAISEVTVSTSNPGAESSAEGAVQIKFVTQGGSNDYHGGLYWYHRNPALNANYWFNNRDQPPDPVTGKAPQARILLNQPGGKVGGPIRIPGLFNGKDKAFFFVNYEEYRLPEKTARTRNILSPEAQSGIYRFTAASNFNPSAGTTCVVSGTGKLCSTNVFNLAGNPPAGVTPLQFTTPDPTIGNLLTSIRGSLSGLVIKTTGDPNIEQVSFTNPGGQLRRFPTVRFDFNVRNAHHVENIWNYQSFKSQVDFLNGVDPAFPNFPNFGSQDSNRFSNTTAWRWTISQNLVNEARYGITGGTVLFFPQVSAAQFENQNGFNLGLGNFASGGLTLTSATVSTAPQRRHTPVRQFSDTLSWVNGNHSYNFGGSFTKITFWQNLTTVVPSAVFTTNSTLDPNGFNAFGSLPIAQQAGAAQLYYLLAGRLTAINANARLSEIDNQYTFLGKIDNRAKQIEHGLFAQDTWRFRPNLTLTYGLRWEVQEPYTSLNDTYAEVSYPDLFGESGEGNLFRPGVLTGGRSTYILFDRGSKAYNSDYGNFAPSVGFAWSPNFNSSFLRRMIGSGGQTVIRGGFSMAYNREGVNVFQAVTGANPGGTITTNRNLTLGNLPVGTYLRQGPFAPPGFPASPTYPNTGLITDSVNAFKPDLKLGYVESWTLGIQREITPNMVVELRYVGNRGHKLWRQYDLNQLNIVENGVLNEWLLAQTNLLANINAGRCQGNFSPIDAPNTPPGRTFLANCQFNFAFFGPNTGTFPLPISLGYFQGLGPASAGTASNYTSTNFRSATFFNTMNPLSSSPLGFGGLLAGTAFDNRRTCSTPGCTPLFPFNHFLVNAGKRGGSFLVDNGAQTWYDAFTIEFRRRMSRGLLMQASYTFAKALSNTYASSSSVFDQPNTLRNPGIRKGVTPFDITHALKANFIYELPIGNGRRYLSNSGGLVNGFLGGWGFNGNIRIQSGSPFLIGNVQLVGMDAKELQEAVGIYRGQKDADGIDRGNVFVFPEDIRLNTFKAFNAIINTNPNNGPLGPLFLQGTPTGRFIAPAGFANCAQTFPGECGIANLVLKGPSFFRSDLSIVKKVRLTETMNFEMRGEFLNAFNNINFLVGAAGNDVNTLGGLNGASFGRYTSAYQDLSTTNDPGGRLVQLVLRFNF
ncbi:MAG TPA: carboxypeptidase-like regulatory domain-containing protein, partial [Pyrinomonadaceae bacterium]|nr:carboxypeptidase-like regulatory domain-containing protein [Pyrinomonadaceae bacterium]